MTDPISDFLTRIRNAVKANHKVVEAPASKMKTEIAKIRAAGISNAQAYRQAGNGITVTVLMAIFGELFGVSYAALLDGWGY